VEAALRARPAGWLDAGFTYALTEARFQEDVLLATPRPTSGCGGPPCTERIRAGSDFPLVPRQRANATLDFHPYGWLSLSVSGTFVGAQYLRGDEENVTAKLDPWFSLDGGVRVTAGGFVAWTRFTNLLNARYNTFGTFAPNPKQPGAPVEPFLTPGRPFQFFAGVGYVFGSAPSTAP
jgi:iron complex outermembrane recepter protein